MIFENAFIKTQILMEEGEKEYEYDLVVHGNLNEIADDGELSYIAAAPADHRFSFMGSGLPFATPEQAFMHTPNKGVVEVGVDGAFKIKLRHPNSYYTALGSKLMGPSITLSYHSSGERRIINIDVAGIIPYRLLTYPKGTSYSRSDPTFYKGTDILPIRTQEHILRDSGYPTKNETHENFWGLKPRH